MARDREPKDGQHRTQGRLGRFARLSSMTASVAARQIGGRIAAAFQDEQQRAKARKRTNQRSAEQIVTTMGQLKGAAMKVGQILSTDPELLPDEMTDALSALQSSAPPMDFETVREVIEAALDCDLDDAFSSFSREAIGAASIGQVHRATTTAGLQVAVKVQYPGIVDTIESDMKNLGSMLNLARVSYSRAQVETYLDEVTQVILRESDYLAEADALELFQTVLHDVEGVRSPAPVHALTRKNVLTMEFVEGERLADFLSTAGPAERTQKAERLIRAYITMMHDHDVLHADPHPGNFLVDTDGQVVFLDLGCVRSYAPAFQRGLIAILLALWRGDLDALLHHLDTLGHSREGVDPELIYEWLEMVLEPLLVDRPFDFGAWPIHERSLRSVKQHPSVLRFAPPKEAIFYLRTLAGLRGLLGQSHTEVNAYRIAKAAVEKMGLL